MAGFIPAMPMTKTTTHRFAILLSLLALAGCSTVPNQVAEPEPPPPPPRDWVGEIRARAQSVHSYVEVLPLQDADTDDLDALARAAEAAGKFNEAEQLVTRALAIHPDDPELWQWRAELALLQMRWTDAQTHARHSEDLGPKLGDLCIRNWMTLKAVAEETGDMIAAVEAETRTDACTVRAPVRL